MNQHSGKMGKVPTMRILEKLEVWDLKVNQKVLFHASFVVFTTCEGKIGLIFLLYLTACVFLIKGRKILDLNTKAEMKQFVLFFEP